MANFGNTLGTIHVTNLDTDEAMMELSAHDRTVLSETTETSEAKLEATATSL